MILTDHFVKGSQGLLSLHPEVRDEGKGYLMYDDGAVEAEVGEFLYGLVRLIKPQHILETGTYTGISALYMAEALKDNGYGRLLTCEIEQLHKDRAEKLWEKTEVEKYVTCILSKSLEIAVSWNFDLLFLDSEPNIRFKELVTFYPQLNPGGYIFIHDTPRGLCQGNINPDHPEIASWPFGDIPEEMKGHLKSGDLVPMHFPNPRGMIGFYKRHPQDYSV